jgi:ActR/RegA family two-component response regulator
MRSQQKLAITPSRKSIPILLVDDDGQLCSSLKRLLGMNGFDVNAVYDGEAGVRHAREGRNCFWESRSCG